MILAADVVIAARGGGIVLTLATTYGMDVSHASEAASHFAITRNETPWCAPRYSECPDRCRCRIAVGAPIRSPLIAVAESRDR